MAQADEIEAATISDQRVRIELVLFPLACESRVIDANRVLTDNGAKDQVQPIVVVAIDLGCVWHRVKLTVEINETLLLVWPAES